MSHSSRHPGYAKIRPRQQQYGAGLGSTVQYGAGLGSTVQYGAGLGRGEQSKSQDVWAVSIGQDSIVSPR